jgi:hypothetical protein
MSLSDALRAQREAKREKHTSRALRNGRKATGPNPPRIPVLMRYGAKDELRLNLVPHVELNHVRDGAGTVMAHTSLSHQSRPAARR